MSFVKDVVPGMWVFGVVMRRGCRWGFGLVEGAVAEHGEQDGDALAGEAGECLGVGLPRVRWRSW